MSRKDIALEVLKDLRTDTETDWTFRGTIPAEFAESIKFFYTSGYIAGLTNMGIPLDEVYDGTPILSHMPLKEK